MYGGNAEDIERAKDELYLERVEVPVQENQIDFICGKNDDNLIYLEERSGAF